MSENDRALLNDMLDSSRRLLKRIEGKQFDELFAEEHLLGDATVRSIEVVGEAAGHVSKAFQAQHPEVEWSKIVGMRNRLIHGYADVNWRIVWEVATQQIPILVRQIEHILETDN